MHMSWADSRCGVPYPSALIAQHSTIQNAQPSKKMLKKRL
jgi:hypothetical protein